MNFLDGLKDPGFKYTNFQLPENPFTIDPLFRDFRDKKLCHEQEKLFIPPTNLKRHLQTICRLKDRRCLVYGGYGVGKTSLIDLILYLSYNFHNRFCLRVIVTEDNVERAINEMLLSLCLEIISEISHRSVLHPIKSLQKWMIERKFGDSLLTAMAKLIGRYTEEKTKVKKNKDKTHLQGSPLGIGINVDIEQEVETRRSIQSYVDILPMRHVGSYLEDMLLIVQKLNFQDIVIFIDEADHLGRIDAFLRMLTKAREVLFARGITFYIAGSPEIARHIESIGIIFDKTLFLEPADYAEFEQLLNHRIRFYNPELSLSNIFDKKSLALIYEATKGIRKQFIRLAENALDIASGCNTHQVNELHVIDAIGMGQDQIQLTLSSSQTKVMEKLAQFRTISPSDREFQTAVDLKRESLRLLLEDLTKQGYVKKERKGRRCIYSIAAPYKPYFTKRNNL